ncbi:hypothetical protein XENOCAPTIV_005985, partial [Xenoophorus captivus]
RLATSMRSVVNRRRGRALCLLVTSLLGELAAPRGRLRQLDGVIQTDWAICLYSPDLGFCLIRLTQANPEITLLTVAERSLIGASLETPLLLFLPVYPNVYHLILYLEIFNGEWLKCCQ